MYSRAAQVVCQNSTLSKLDRTEGVSRVCRERVSSAMYGDELKTVQAGVRAVLTTCQIVDCRSKLPESSQSLF
jgi:hypothetical protein